MSENVCDFAADMDTFGRQLLDPAEWDADERTAYCDAVGKVQAAEDARIDRLYPR